MFLWCELVFLVLFAYISVGVCFCTGFFGVLLWMLQPSVVGDPLLSLMVFETIGKCKKKMLMTKQISAKDLDRTMKYKSH